MNKPEIVATLGNLFCYKDVSLIEQLLSLGINYFRFNLSKYENLKLLQERISLINKLRSQYPDKIKIMLDIPYPGRKPRIYLNCEKKEITQNDLLVLTSDKEKKGNNDTIYINVESLTNKIDIGTEIIYADGEGVFQVLEFLDDYNVVVKSMDSFTLYNAKSLSFNFFAKRVSLSKEYVNMLTTVNANAIALSFVTNEKEVQKLKHFFLAEKVISKIESSAGIMNINVISTVSDIMLGRGDLCLNSNYCNLYNYQQQVTAFCKKNQKKLYIATGILSSLIVQSRPSQADIIDVSNLLKLNPNYLVLNYALVKNNCALAVKTINNIFQCICGDQNSYIL